MDKKRRTCIITRSKDKKENMIQIVFFKGILKINNRGQTEKGRSVYLMPDNNNLMELKKRGAGFLSKMIKREISQNLFSSL